MVQYQSGVRGLQHVPRPPPALGDRPQRGPGRRQRSVRCTARARPSVCNTSTESWAIREGANYYDPPDLAKAAQLRDAAGFGDDNPVTGDHAVLHGESRAARGATAVFSQLQLGRLVGVEPPGRRSVGRSWTSIRSGIDWTSPPASPGSSPFDPDATMRPVHGAYASRTGLYGSPEGGSGTGRASLADYPNDQVLQGHRGDRSVHHGGHEIRQPGGSHRALRQGVRQFRRRPLLVRPRHPRTPLDVPLDSAFGGLWRPGEPRRVPAETPSMARRPRPAAGTATRGCGSTPSSGPLSLLGEG